MQWPISESATARVRYVKARVLTLCKTDPGTFILVERHEDGQPRGKSGEQMIDLLHFAGGSAIAAIRPCAVIKSLVRGERVGPCFFIFFPPRHGEG